jgi:hypothetical protein
MSKHKRWADAALNTLETQPAQFSELLRRVKGVESKDPEIRFIALVEQLAGEPLTPRQKARVAGQFRQRLIKVAHRILPAAGKAVVA